MQPIPPITDCPVLYEVAPECDERRLQQVFDWLIARAIEDLRDGTPLRAPTSPVETVDSCLSRTLRSEQSQ